jgi:hypothetical protein
MAKVYTRRQRDLRRLIMVLKRAARADELSGRGSANTVSSCRGVSGVCHRRLRIRRLLAGTSADSPTVLLTLVLTVALDAPGRAWTV